jgi:protease-4
MTASHDPASSLTPTPAASPASSSPPRQQSGGVFARLGRVFLTISTLVNLIVLGLGVVLAVMVYSAFHRGDKLSERFQGGDRASPNKIAIIRIEGVLFEGLLDYAVRQIDTVAEDDRVKAVVVRIISPGGTITASDFLHKRLNDLRRGDNPRRPGRRNPRPVVVSLGSIAASGGYYIAMIRSDPPTPILAEPTTITGSIGVYAAFPNVEKLSDKVGFTMNVIKAGDIKASGSPFRKMTGEEQRVWQHMVDHAYLHFLDVVAAARTKPPLTREKLQDDVDVKETLPVREGPNREKHLHYKRYRADGGIFTAGQAWELGLIDRLGYTNDAVKEAARLADLGEDYQAITYDRPPSLLRAILGAQAPAPLDADRISSAVTPRLWYLAPQHELAGMMTALGR